MIVAALGLTVLDIVILDNNKYIFTSVKGAGGGSSSLGRGSRANANSEALEI